MLILPLSIKAQTETLICDNGGFEADFLYYFGYSTSSSDFHGSDNCFPIVDITNQPVVWNSSSLPSFRNFTIVSSGIDTLVGFNRTKFGSKALLLNNRYDVAADVCDGNFGINKIVKRFKVTEANRDFTVWFAVILENPGDDHTNTQPFFNISCDRAPGSNLCFDASQLACEDDYYDNLCGFNFDPVDAVDWTCHRIKIPKNMVDSIATLEIIAADCGEGAHFGYAYIDGICEECNGSALGSSKLYDYTFNSTGLGIKYKSCYGDTIAICGDYILPTVCGTWTLDSIQVPGFTVLNLEINHTALTYCFDLSKSEFPEDSCSELYGICYFSSNLTGFTSNVSNSIEICDDEFEEYDADVTTGICQNNATTVLISDDYYYVSIDLSVNYGDFWTMERELHNPLPTESGAYVIRTGTGSCTIDLGPILIQEGSWDLTINIGGCILFYEITPPFFCSGCNKFYRTKIFDFTCDDNHGGASSLNPFDDWWTFKINVPGLSGNYYVYKVTDSPSSSYTYGTSPTHDHVIQVGTIGLECVEYILEDVGTGCKSNFIVCPPKPCSADCDLEAYVTEVVCDEEEFYVDLAVSGAGSSYYCYEIFAMNDPGNTTDPNYYQGSFSNPLGPFTEDVYVIVYLCPSSACTCDPTCFKIIYLPLPDCENLEFHNKGISNSKIKPTDEVFVVPNPVNNNEFVLRSSMKVTSYEFYNSTARLIHHGSFTGPEYRYRAEISPGLYFVRYQNSEGQYRYIKVVKM